VRRETLDMQAVAITRGVSASGGATDLCRDNLIAAWPLLQQAGRSQRGLFLLSERVKACTALQNEDDLLGWAQQPFFFMAEGNYPFPSTYITFSVGPPGTSYPLPAWPMRVACAALNRDFGIRLKGSIADVRYSLTLGALNVSVDWNISTGNGPNLTSAELAASGVLELAAAIAEAAGVWYNVTKDKQCFDISRSAASGDADISIDISGSNDILSPASSGTAPTMAREGGVGGPHCAACPPCDDCPPCPGI
jgi:hypothetical protein